MANLEGICPNISLTKYNCKICNYNTSYKKDYNKHLNTSKHKRLTNTNDANNNVLNSPKIHNCKCGKEFKHASSLCKHKKTCTYTTENTVFTISNNQTATSIVEKKEDMSDMKELVIALMTQNQDMQKQMFEQQQQILKLIPQSENTTNNV